jgi:predicted peptidase
MHHTGMQQPHTSRWSRPHRRALPYFLFLPAAYTRHVQRWPLLLFLHGAGDVPGSYDAVASQRHRGDPTAGRSCPSGSHIPDR